MVQNESSSALGSGRAWRHELRGRKGELYGETITVHCHEGTAAAELLYPVTAEGKSALYCSTVVAGRVYRLIQTPAPSRRGAITICRRWVHRLHQENKSK